MDFKLMNTIFGILLFVVSTALFFGLISPKILHNKNITSRKKVLGIFGSSMLVLFIAFAATLPPTTDSKTQTANAQATTAPTATSNTAVKPTMKSIQKMNIVITSMIVKKVAPSKYRYFFNIANQDKTDFKGNVFIQLFNGHNTPQALIFGGATQSYSDSPISAGANSVATIEDSHAPYQVDGIDGASTFTYAASFNNNDVASGKGSITDQYENDLQQ